MQRRTFLQLLVAAAVSCMPRIRLRADTERPRPAFLHGVASGDPTQEAVVLWTRISGLPALARTANVQWQVAEDAEFQRVVAKGIASTGAERDFTVKVDVGGLPPGRMLWYRFDSDGIASPIGRTRTLPAGSADRVRFAVTSCSNHPAGYFHAYREIAERQDVDAVLHLGDYVYEYGPGEYATEHAEALDRVPEPPGECVTLIDYRIRHAQYKRDPDSQAMHAAHPLIAVWDDHELANDAWQDGAQNHQAGEGAWPSRRDAAVRAWFEWMPVRGTFSGSDVPTYRAFRYGDLAHLVMLDTRLIGRDRQPHAGEDTSPESVRASLRDPQRRMLGAAQEQWLRDQLEAGRDTVWQVLGQQVKMAEMLSPDLAPIVDPDGPSFFPRERLAQIIAESSSNPPSLLDTWDGYPAARRDLLADIARLARNPVILSGDMHTSMAANLELDGETVAVELMTPSVTSPGITAALPEKSPNALRDATLAQNPHMQYMEMHDRGWLCVTLTRNQCSAEWHLLNGVRQRDYEARIDRTLQVAAGEVRHGLAGALIAGDSLRTIGPGIARNAGSCSA